MPTPEAYARTAPPVTEVLFIGLDLGTSGCRAIAIDTGQTVVAEARAPLPPPQRHGAAIEQAPALWWDAAREVLRALVGQLERRFGNGFDSGRIAALAIDGTSGTVLHCDANGQVAGPALMYHDARARAEAELIKQHAPAETAAHGPSATLAKLLWLQAHRSPPAGYRPLHQADWVAGCLTGRYDTTDANNALKLGYDARSGDWPAWLEALGVDRAGLPHVLAPGTPLAPILPAVAVSLGLPARTLVVAGTTDSTAAFLATGARTSGEAVTSLGSTLVLKVIAEQPVFAPAYGVYSQPLPELVLPVTASATSGDHASRAAVPAVSGRTNPRPGQAVTTRQTRWLVGGGSNSGGAVLRQFFTDAELERLTAQLQPDHPTGLDYYPLPASGERFPVCDPALAPRLSPRPDDAARFLQGLLEGMARIEADGYRLLARLGAPWPVTVRSVGGGAANPAWTQIRSRQLGVPLLMPRHQEAAYGTALLARYGFLSLA